MSKSKKFLILVISLSILFCVAVSFYVLSIVSDLNMKLKLPAKKGLQNQKKINIDSNTYLEKNKFKLFLAFSNNKFEKITFDHLLKSEAITAERNFYTVRKNIQLAALKNNHCKRIYCFQHKLPFDDIPSSLWKSLIEIEDTRFLDHHGVDPISIARAIVVDVMAMKFKQGGSTLTQQLVKNLFLYNEKSIKRKFIELVYSIYLETQVEKEDILTAYFNEISWGSLNGIQIKGFYSASVMYFNKKPSEMTDFEASILISMLKGPYYYSPINHLDRLKERVSVVFNKLSMKDAVDSNVKAWSDKKWLRWQKSLIKNIKLNNYKSIWKVMMSKTTYLNDYQKYIFINSSYGVLDWLKNKYKDADIAVKAIIKPVNCKSNCETFKYYSKYERKLDNAINMENHQVGSILKPIVYSIFFESGKTKDDYISSDPITLKLKSGKWTPKDGHKIKMDEYTLEHALKKSLNIPLIKLSNEYGFDKLESSLEKYFYFPFQPLSEYPAQLLGSVEFSLEKISNIYESFLTNQCEAIKNGLEFDDSVLNILANPTETTLSRVVSKKMSGHKFFGKTGTSNKALDNWFISFDGENLYVIWVGVESNRKSTTLRLSGATTAYNIFQNFIMWRGERFSELNCVKKQ
jgi:penicillin-binding protein 1B